MNSENKGICADSASIDVNCKNSVDAVPEITEAGCVVFSVKGVRSKIDDLLFVVEGVLLTNIACGDATDAIVAEARVILFGVDVDAVVSDDKVLTVLSVVVGASIFNSDCVSIFRPKLGEVTEDNISLVLCRVSI